jgi:hypothetical protein
MPRNTHRAGTAALALVLCLGTAPAWAQSGADDTRSDRERNGSDDTLRSPSGSARDRAPAKDADRDRNGVVDRAEEGAERIDRENERQRETGTPEATRPTQP